MDEVKVASAPIYWNSSGWKDKPWSALHLAPLFTALTGDDTAPVWARRAVKFIHRYAREHGHSPTFREVFTDLAGHDLHAAENQAAWTSSSVRYLTMVHWQRRGWIRFRREPRTLRSGHLTGELFAPKPARDEPTRQFYPSAMFVGESGLGESSAPRSSSSAIRSSL